MMIGIDDLLPTLVTNYILQLTPSLLMQGLFTTLSELTASNRVKIMGNLIALLLYGVVYWQVKIDTTA